MKIGAVALVVSAVFMVSLSAIARKPQFTMIENSEFSILESARLRCQLDAITRVTEKYGIGSEWAKERALVEPSLEKLSNCGDNKDCFFKEQVDIFSAMTHYSERLRGTRPDVDDETLVEIVKCNPKPELSTINSYTISYEDNEEIPLDGSVDYAAILACAIDIGQNVTEENDMSRLWGIFGPDLLLQSENVKNCSRASDKEAVLACFNRVSQPPTILITYGDFLLDVKAEKEEAAAKIVQLYRSECLNAEPAESTTSFIYPVFMLLVFILAIL